MMKLKLVLIIHSGPDTHTRRVSNSVNTIQWTQFSEYNPMDTIHSMDLIQCACRTSSLCVTESNKNETRMEAIEGPNLE